MDNALHYRIEARSLQIMPDSSEATAHVALQGSSRITVAALAGVVRVTTAEGTLLARLEPGRALQFEPQAAGGAAPFAVTGCLDGSRQQLHPQGRHGPGQLRGEGGSGPGVGQPRRQARRGDRYWGEGSPPGCRGSGGYLCEPGQAGRGCLLPCRRRRRRPAPNAPRG